MQGNRLHYAGNWFGERVRASATVAIPAGEATLRVDVLRVAKDEVLVRFFVDAAAAGEGRITSFRPAIFAGEPLEVGRDGMTPVDDAYDSPFEFGVSLGFALVRRHAGTLKIDSLPALGYRAA